MMDRIKFEKIKSQISIKLDIRPHQFILLFLRIGGPFFLEMKKKKKKLPTHERTSADIHLYLSVG